AAGIFSYAPNQHTAWWKQDETLVRWGHLDTFSTSPTFAFMISLGDARALRDRLAKGEHIRLHAIVRAGQHPGFYEITTATIPGSLPKEEIVYSCHLDHPRPGANDNASGCATILEVARTLSKRMARRRRDAPRAANRSAGAREAERARQPSKQRPRLAEGVEEALPRDVVA